jgi:hypothetical protein
MALDRLKELKNEGPGVQTDKQIIVGVRDAELGSAFDS